MLRKEGEQKERYKKATKVTNVVKTTVNVLSTTYFNKLHRLIERDSRLAHYFALMGVWAMFGLHRYFQCKIWRHIRARRPQFPTKMTKFRAHLASFSGSHFGVFLSLELLLCKVWCHILARRSRFPTNVTKLRVYLAYLSRSPFRATWGFSGF